MPLPTRRQAFVAIAAGLSARSLAAQDRYVPTTFTPKEYELLGTLADMILPASETPGARDVGVHAILDEELADSGDVLAVLRNGLRVVHDSGFEGMDEHQRSVLLAGYSHGEGPERRFFETLKGLTVDAYYSTEVGLVDELGYRGNTYLATFPGCTHEHELEDAG